MKTALQTAIAIAAVIATPFTPAQTISSSSPTNGASQGYTFAVVNNSDLRSMHGGWQGTAPLLRYVQNHKGTYVAFEKSGTVYRLDKPDQLARIDALCAPLRALEAEQRAFAQVQEPLARQQHTLDRRRIAAGDPQEKGRIGITQGALGEEQGEIGTLQGQLGERQGQLGRHFYQDIQGVFQHCIGDGSCLPAS